MNQVSRRLSKRTISKMLLLSQLEVGEIIILIWSDDQFFHCFVFEASFPY